MSNSEIYVSTDIESSGPVAGINHMLSIGSVAFDEDGKEIGAFYAVLDQPDVVFDDSTRAWWAEHPRAWMEVSNKNGAYSPEVAMGLYLTWLKNLPGTPVFVGSPACWDFSFVFYYLKRYTGESPFLHRGLDMRSFMMGMDGTRFRSDRESRALWKKYSRGIRNPFDHHALHDAREQGEVFCRMLRESKERKGVTVKV